jgi:hypothetical protein
MEYSGVLSVLVYEDGVPVQLVRTLALFIGAYGIRHATRVPLWRGCHLERLRSVEAQEPGADHRVVRRLATAVTAMSGLTRTSLRRSSAVATLSPVVVKPEMPFIGEQPKARRNVGTMP